MNADQQCELDFWDNGQKIYYEVLNNVPDIVINFETFETAPVQLPYPNAQIMALYMPNKYQNPVGFYFVNTYAGWKLAFVDNTLCGA